MFGIGGKYVFALTLMVAAAGGLAVPGLAQAQVAGTIQVHFTNGTGQEVIFLLNGGEGLETRLFPGQGRDYTMVVDHGVQPIVRIYQPFGDPLTFTVANGGRYVFRLQNGRIINTFE